MSQSQIQDFFRELSTLSLECSSLAPLISEASKIIQNSLSKGNCIFTAGNGGSAAEAMHMSAEFTGRYKKERSGLRSVCLNCDISALTAISNDYSYEQVFSRQLEALSKEGDILILFSTSGNSPNLISLAKAAKTKKVKVISLLGKGGGKIAPLSDLSIIVPSQNTPRIQEIHQLIMHSICETIDNSK